MTFSQKRVSRSTGKQKIKTAMRLFLLRHADAKDAWPDDSRELSKRGFVQVRRLSEILDSSIFGGVVEIWHSPYARAVQTAKEFKGLSGMSAALRETKCLRPDDDPQEAARGVASVASFGGDLMIVGHNPHLERLADILLDCKDSFCRTTFHKCAMAMFVMVEEPSQLAPCGRWNLSFLVAPTILSE